ncbi:hypothetical protein [Sanyastnella coralliicola]|uniref:hypothetical protein n=1 Tax=Sanyastnella coralliicola TaxID=3069118 RepID=UPI0027B9B414|nr:hypothetical protein [Longitalea sp. SCSIO 12813]
MLKDIDNPKVEGVAFAIAEEVNELNEKSYVAYLINLKDEPLENVLVRSSGYGEHDGKQVKTTELRRFYDSIEPKSAQLIEPVLEEALTLTNQYWVSFYNDKVLYDRKYVFVAESVNESNFISLPLIDHSGVLIK